MSESLSAAGKALCASLTYSRGGDISISISTDSVVVAGLFIGATAVTLGVIYARDQQYSRKIDDAVNKGLGGKRDDQEIRNIKTGSLHVLLHCFTDERFLQVVADYETGSMKERFQNEFTQAGIEVKGLKVDIQNEEEVYKTKKVINDRMDAKQKECDNLNEEQTNCLMWPELIPWGDSRDVEVHRQNPNSHLGLVSTAVQDLEIKDYYHITKPPLKANHPVHSIVRPYEWIFAVDGKRTTNGKEISNLINNGQSTVRLSMKKAVDALSSVKKWSVEKDVQLDIKEDKYGFELDHFYCKDENGTVKDHILIWDVKPGTLPKPSEPLYRGDELLKVNGVAVEGKKLAEIYKLIFQKIPGLVILTIKEIQRGECQEKLQVDAVPGAPPQKDQSVESEGDSSNKRPPERSDTTSNSQEEKLHVDAVPGAPPQKDQSVETEGDSSNERPPERSDTTSNSQEDTEGSATPQQESDSGGSSQRRENQGYAGTLEAITKTSPTPSTVKMCSSCFAKGETRLPDDRNQWRINKIDIASFEEICKLLDNDSASKVPLLTAFPDSFDQTEASSIKQQFSATGGVGMAKTVLKKWGNYKRSHNVGALKVIVNDILKRDDVLEEIEKWETRYVCHGCGIRLKD